MSQPVETKDATVLGARGTEASAGGAVYTLENGHAEDLLVRADPARAGHVG